MERSATHHSPSGTFVPINQLQVFLISEIYCIFITQTMDTKLQQNTWLYTAGGSTRDVNGFAPRGLLPWVLYSFGMHNAKFCIMLWASYVYEFTPPWGWNPKKDSACFLFLLTILLQILKQSWTKNKFIKQKPKLKTWTKLRYTTGKYRTCSKHSSYWNKFVKIFRKNKNPMPLAHTT